MITDEMVEAAAKFVRDTHEAVRAALEAADAAAWQPIETAPRDGTHILVGTFPVSPGHVTITTAHWWHEAREWALSINYDGAYSNHGVAAPTHWRPLPGPPEKQWIERMSNPSLNSPPTTFKWRRNDSDAVYRCKEARVVADQLDTPSSGISFIPTAGAAQTIRDLIAMVESAQRELASVCASALPVE